MNTKNELARSSLHFHPPKRGKLRTGLLLHALVAAVLLFGLAAAQAATLTVTSGDDSGPGTLRQAILTGVPGDTINFAAGITTINLTSDELLIDKDLTINGPGAKALTVKADIHGFRIFEITAGNVILSGLTITKANLDRSQPRSGAGISTTSNGTVSIIACTVTGNETAYGTGAGIYSNGGTVIITDSTISNNQAGTIFRTGGGGISNSNGTMTITNSTVSGNFGYYSNGIDNYGGIVTIINSTVSDNLGPFQGCGIYNDTGGTVNLTNCTIASNQGTAGVRNRDGAVNARNTIIARNNSADFNGTLTSQGYNFIQNASGTTVVPAQSTDQIGLGLDAMLGPLQDNGGPTFTRALLNGSPAIDKGGPVAGIITDQRGMPRPIRYNSSITEPSGGDGSDIGAFEVSPIQFGAANYSANEDAGSVTLTVTRSGDTSKGATVHYQTSDGTATAGSDYNSASGDLTFASDEISKDIVITLNDDNVYEGDETFRITLSAPVGADLGLSVATVTILENEAAPPTPTPTATPTATPPKALNISTRSRVETGDNVLIGGMIVTGNVSKSVIFRALGPSLLGSGIPGALPDPTLELRDAANNLIAFNDNWQDLQKQQIQDTGLAPKNDLDSAIVIRLDPNRSYTAIVRGKNGEVGVALVEAYDLEEGADSRLANISSRAFVQTNDNVLIAGFIIGGAPSTSAKLVLRGLGPSLADVGITNPLQDPTMVAYDANGNTVGANDDWKQGQQPEIVAAGLAPKDDRESALYLQLGPGNYTAIVGGKNNATGAGLVEVYNVP